jgi:hypothetical protein
MISSSGRSESETPRRPTPPNACVPVSTVAPLFKYLRNDLGPHLLRPLAKPVECVTTTTSSQQEIRPHETRIRPCRDNHITNNTLVARRSTSSTHARLSDAPLLEIRYPGLH